MIYLDWNVFNQIEKMADLPGDLAFTYHKLLQIIKQKELKIPYSNAHMSDLYRGFVKNPVYTSGHIDNIRRQTGNLCMVQYWGESTVKIHVRCPQEFFMATVEEFENTPGSLSALLGQIDDPLAKSAFNLQLMTMRMMPMDKNFQTIYTVSPILGSMFPKTKLEMNVLAFSEDLYNFSRKIKTDYALYKNYRKFLAECQQKFPNYKAIYQDLDSKIIGNPKNITWDDVWDIANQNWQPTSNALHDKIVQLFTTTDLKGYSQDERFANLMDDALHTFYASYCRYFITLDARCYSKAKLVYDKLKIPTQVLTPSELVSLNES